MLYVIEDAAGRYERYVTSNRKANEVLALLATDMNEGEELYLTIYKVEDEVYSELDMVTFRVDEFHNVRYIPNE
jgi:hypothetical protein